MESQTGGPALAPGGAPQAGSLREGRRMSALASAYSRAIKFSLRGIDEETFASTFPDVHPDLLEILWEGYRRVLHGARVHIESDFDTICEEAALPDKLHQLEELCDAQGISQDGAAPMPEDPNGPGARPTQAVWSALMSARRAEMAQLESILASVSEERSAVETELQQRLSRVEDACRDLRPLAALDTNVSRACGLWETHKVQSLASA